MSKCAIACRATLGLVSMLLPALTAGAVQAANGVPDVTPAVVNAVEGAPFSDRIATFTDAALKGNICAPAGDYQSTVDWGDGSADASGTIAFTSGPDQSNLCHYSLDGTHTWEKAGDYTTKIDVTGPSSPTAGTATLTAHVSDAPLTASSPGNQTATAGTGFAGRTATFTDGAPNGTVSDYTATISWGDGTTAPGTVTSGSGNFVVNGSHVYSAAGSYTVITTIDDVGGASTSTSFTMTVATGATTTTTSTTTSSTSTTTSTPTSSTSSTTSTPLPPPPPLTPPFTISLSGPAARPLPGAMTSIVAHPTISPGETVVGYRWRIGTSGAYSIDTGDHAVLSHRFGSGVQTVGVIGIASDGTASSAASFTFTTASLGASVSCFHQYDANWLYFSDPSCMSVVRPSSHHGVRDALPTPTGGTLPPPRATPPYIEIPVPAQGISMNGLEVQCVSDPCDINVSPYENFANPQLGTGLHAYFLSSSGPVRMILPNTIDGPVVLGQDQLGFIFTGNPSDPSVPFDSVALPSGQQFGGLPVTGTADIALVRPGDNGPAFSVTFNLTFSVFGQSFTHPTTIDGSTDGDTADAPGDWSIDLSGLIIPPLISFDDLRISYQDHLDTPSDYMGPPLDHVYSGEADATILLTGTDVSAQMIIANGAPIYTHFSYDKGQGGLISAGGGAAAAAGVSIDHLEGLLQTAPFFQIGGSVVLDLGNFKVGGSLFYYAPHGTTPFQLYVQSTIPVVTLPGLDLSVAAFITGDPHPGFGAAGHLEWSKDPWIDIDAGIYAFFAGGDPAEVEFGFNAGLKILGIPVAAAAGFINQSWIAGCGQIFGISGWAVAPLVAGEDGNNGWGGCDNIAPYSDAPLLFSTHARAHSAAPGSQIHVPKGISWTNIKVTSATGVPSVQVSGPGINYVSPTANGVHPAGSAATAVLAANHTAVIGLHNARPGQYTITPAPGSPALTGVQDSIAPPVTITGKLGGQGQNRTLRYSVTRQAGQRVLFEERTGHGFQQLGVIKGGGSGTLRFHPGAFDGRARTILALPSMDGMPRGTVTVARYTAPPPVVPPAPRPLTLRYAARRSTVTATWRAVGAARYQIRVRASDGRRFTVLVTRNRLTLPAVFPGARLTLAVRGQSAAGRDGRWSQATLKIAARSRTPAHKVHRA